MNEPLKCFHWARVKTAEGLETNEYAKKYHEAHRWVWRAGTKFTERVCVRCGATQVVAKTPGSYQ